MSKTLVATTQEVGGSVWATLDYAFQADSFEPYETLVIDETLMPSDEKKPVVGETHLLEATMPNGDKYTVEIICEQDITDEDEGFDDFLWRTNLYKGQLIRRCLMSEPMTENESLIWASGHFLTDQFPKEFTNWSEEQVDEFILSNAWEPCENWSAQDVWESISGLAYSIRNLLYIRYGEI